MVASAQLGQTLQPEHDGERGTRLVVQVALVARRFTVLVHQEVSDLARYVKAHKSHTLRVNARPTVSLAKVLAVGSLVMTVLLSSGVELRFKTWCAGCAE